MEELVYNHAVKDDLLGGYQSDDNLFPSQEECLENLKSLDKDYLKYWKHFSISASLRSTHSNDVYPLRTVMYLTYKRGKFIIDYESNLTTKDIFENLQKRAKTES